MRADVRDKMASNKKNQKTSDFACFLWFVMVNYKCCENEMVLCCRKH